MVDSRVEFEIQEVMDCGDLMPSVSEWALDVGGGLGRASVKAGEYHVEVAGFALLPGKLPYANDICLGGVGLRSVVRIHRGRVWIDGEERQPREDLSARGAVFA